MKTGMQYWLDGYHAAEKGWPEDACPLMWAAWPRDAWLQGWRFYRDFAMPQESEELQRVEITAERQGRIAYAKGIDLNDCPYGPDSEDAQAWCRGWVIAYELNNGRNFDDASQLAYCQTYNMRKAESWPIGFILLMIFVIGAGYFAYRMIFGLQ